MRTLLKLVFSFTAIFAVSAVCFAQVIATVGSKKITQDEFNKKYNEVQAQTLNPPTKETFLEDLIRFEMGVQEAEKKKLKDDPLVQERMRQEVYKVLLERQLGEAVEKTEVSEDEMKRWYQNNPEIRTSHILIEVPPNPTAKQKKAAQKRASEIYAKVRKSKKPFEQLVNLYTDDPLSKQTGGDVGWQSRVTLFPTFYEAALSMKLNEVKGIVETPFGYHIIRLTGRRSYENANKRQIRTAVFDEKRKDIFNKYFSQLKKNYKIEINKKLIQ